MACKDNTAHLGGEINCINNVLNAHWDAVKDSRRLPATSNFIQGASLIQGMLSVHMSPGADLFIGLLDYVEAVSDQTFRSQNSLLDQLNVLSGWFSLNQVGSVHLFQLLSIDRALRNIDSEQRIRQP